MEQEISCLEGSLKEKDSQLSSFKSILEQTQAQLTGAQEQGRDLTARLGQLNSERATLREQVDSLRSRLSESETALEASSGTVNRLEQVVETLKREGESLVTNNMTPSKWH